MSRLSDVICLDIRLIGLGIYRDQQHYFLVVQVEVNHPSAAALAFACDSPPNLACTVCAWNYRACLWILGNPVNELITLILRPDFLCLFLESRSFDDGVRIFIVTTNKLFDAYLLFHGLPKTDFCSSMGVSQYSQGLLRR